MSERPLISAHESHREITLRAILLSILLAIVLAASNTFLALKVGILTSASIPAAVIAMGVLRFFKGSNILETNLVQTAASAGEAVAGGIVYTIPALIILHYWTHFGYLHNLLIALVGGVLGVLFSVPLRRVLINDKDLRFPEAQAITKILVSQHQRGNQFRYLLKGGLVGGLLEFLQNGLQVVASSAQGFISVGKSLIGFGTGFSATLIGAGYLIGFNIGISLFIGAIIGYGILIPILSGVYHLTASGATASAQAQDLWGNYIRFVGIGSMLTAGVWTLLMLLKPIGNGIRASMRGLRNASSTVLRTERDVPLTYVIVGTVLALIATYYLFKDLLPVSVLGLAQQYTLPFLIACVLFVLIIGFLFAAICGYFSGLVGVSASPGSSIVIGGLLIVAFVLRALIHAHDITLTHEVVMNASAIVVILISVVTGIACITNDNIQDLKVGQLVGSTPWKQQFMLLMGALVAAAVIPLLMQLLFSVYGIGGVYPHPGMDPSKMLSAPVPSVLATVTLAVFDQQLPLHMLLVGVGITLFFIVLNFFLKKLDLRLSILGIAMGLYLPLSSSTPLFIGSLMALLMQKVAKRQQITEEKEQRGVVLACGLVAGAALMDVLLAIPFAIKGDPNALNIMPAHLQPLGIVLGIIAILYLINMFYRSVLKEPQ